MTTPPADADLRAALERLVSVAMTEEEDVSATTQDEWIAAIEQANVALASTAPAPALTTEDHDGSTLASALRALEETYDLPDDGIVDWSMTLWHDPSGWHVTVWRSDTTEDRADDQTPIGAIRQLADPRRLREHAPTRDPLPRSRAMPAELVLGFGADAVVVRFASEDEVAVTHPTPDGKGRCTAWFDGMTHRITSEVPLTIEPSLDCPECGWHHTITEGQVR